MISDKTSLKNYAKELFSGKEIAKYKISFLVEDSKIKN